MDKLYSAETVGNYLDLLKEVKHTCTEYGINYLDFLTEDERNIHFLYNEKIIKPEETYTYTHTYDYFTSPQSIIFINLLAISNLRPLRALYLRLLNGEISYREWWL